MRVYFPTLRLPAAPEPDALIKRTENFTRFYSSDGILHLQRGVPRGIPHLPRGVSHLHLDQTLMRMHIQDGPATALQTTLFSFNLPCVVDFSTLVDDEPWWQVPVPHVVCEVRRVAYEVNATITLVLETEWTADASTCHFFFELETSEPPLAAVQIAAPDILKGLNSLQGLA
jgi:hypothetical protein